MKIYITPFLLTLPFVAGESLRAPSRKLGLNSLIEKAKKAAVEWPNQQYWDYSDPNIYMDRFKTPYERIINNILEIYDPYTVVHSGTASYDCPATNNKFYGDISYGITEVSGHSTDWTINDFTFDDGATMVYEERIGKPNPRVLYGGTLTLNMTIPTVSATFTGKVTLADCPNTDGAPHATFDILEESTGTLKGSTIQVVLNTRGSIMNGEPGTMDDGGTNDRFFIYKTTTVESLQFTAGSLLLDGDPILDLLNVGLISSGTGTTAEKLLESIIDQYAQEDILNMFNEAVANELTTFVENSGFWD